MDKFRLIVLLRALELNMNVTSRLDNIKNLTVLGDYIKKENIKDEYIINIYIDASDKLLGGTKKWIDFN